MGLFDFLKRKKPAPQTTVITDAMRQWSKLWSLWSDNEIESPYCELMSYSGEVNNGGHYQFFDNIANNGDLSQAITALDSLLPAAHRDNLHAAYQAYLTLEEADDDAAAAAIDQCDHFFYANEEEINRILEQRAAGIAL